MNNNIRSAFDGRVITPKADPSSVVQVPWNNVTLTFGATGSATLTVANILTALQVVFPTNSLYQIQVKSARLWELTGIPLAAIFNSLDVSNPGALKHQDDFPARNHWARLGYIWPRSHQNQILTNASAGTNPVLQVNAGSTASIVLHVEITWKPIVVPNPSISSFVLSTSAHVIQSEPSALSDYTATRCIENNLPYVSSNFETDTIPCSFPDPSGWESSEFINSSPEFLIPHSKSDDLSVSSAPLAPSDEADSSVSIQ